MYALPRSPQRFANYLRTMVGSDGHLTLPLSLMNPMARDDAVLKLDALIALDAEGIARATLADAERELAAIEEDVRVALVLTDDAGGGWTNRTFADMHSRFEPKYFVEHRWSVAVFWTIETYDADAVRRTVRGAVRRTVHQRRHGLPKTLEAMMTQEGTALAFAGERVGATPEQLRVIRDIIAPLRGTTAFGTAVAALYGDDAALQCGYARYGIPPNGGFDLALAQARGTEF